MNKKTVCSILCIVCILLGVIVIGIYYLFISDGDSQPNEGVNSSDLYRRPSTNLIPLHYDVEIRPILDNDDPRQFEAPGKVVITVKCVKTTNVITLNSSIPIILDSSVQVKETLTGVPINIQSFNSTKETYTITVENALEVNKIYDVYIEYVAHVAGKEYYEQYIQYEDENGILRYTGQFGNNDSAFPCFNYEAFRATFKISIGYNRLTGYHAISNTDIMTTRRNYEIWGWQWNDYEINRNMTVSAVAIFVSTFQFQEAPAGLYRSPVRIWGRKLKIKKERAGLYAAITTAKSLAFYEEYFDQTYDLPKLDSVGIPDGASTLSSGGATAKWGMLIYREDKLFFYENHTTEEGRYIIGHVITHEVAHQWFGFLVEITGYNDLWLIEGIATYASSLALSHIYPEFDSLNTEVVTGMQQAMELDIRGSTIPLSSYEHRPPNLIVYLKGVAMMRMVQAFLGERTFKKGLRSYLKEKRYGNAAQDDLFRNLNTAAEENTALPKGLDVKEIMDTWTLQSGFPLVRVKKVNKTTILISQERYKNVVQNITLSNRDLWWVPITYTTRSAPKLNIYYPKKWLSKTTLLKNVFVKNVDLDSDWILVNPDARSYYRVLYDNGLTDLITMQLQNDPSVFTSASRSQLIDDYFAAAYSGYIPFGKAMSFTMYLGKEDTHLVWKTVRMHLQNAFTLLQYPDFDLLVNYLGPKINESLHLIGTRQAVGEKGGKLILRGDLYEWACAMRLDVCKDYALELYDEWMAHPEKNPDFSFTLKLMPSDIRDTMVCAGMALGDINIENFITTQFKKSPRNGDAREIYMHALSCHSDPRFLDSWLAKAFANEDLFTIDEAYMFLTRVAFKPKGLHSYSSTAFEFMETEFDNIFWYIDTGEQLVVILFRALANFYYTDDAIHRMENMVTKHRQKLAPVVEELNTHIQTAKDNNAGWMERFGGEMIDWLMNHQ